MDTAHIYIYGEIGYWQSSNAKDYGEVTLTDVQAQYNAQKDAKEIRVHIHSNGGYLTEGFAIHDFLKAQGKPITTVIEGICYSIATVIALAGDTRIMTPNSEFMIHNPMGGEYGNADELQLIVDDLRKSEKRIADFYAERTNVSAEKQLELMKSETFISAEEALEMGFITEIATVMKAVALLKTKNEKAMSKEVATKDDLDGMFKKAMKSIKKIITSNKKLLLLQDANGTEIDFPDVAEGESPTVGDNATVDGNPAEGEYTMPDGTVYVFASGSVAEVKESEGGSETEELAQLQEENATQATEIVNLKRKLKIERKEKENLVVAVKALKKDIKKIKNIAGEFEIDDTKKDIKKKKKSKGVRSL